MREEANRVAVITGGAGAIGRAIGAELSIAGHTVVRLDLAGDPPVDLAHEDEVRAAADRVLDRHGRCDVLVHAAAAFDRAVLDATDLTVTSKGALIALARALAVGYGADGIAVMCVAPGLTETTAGRRGQPAAVFEDVRSRQPQPRTLMPGAAALTSQTLCADGGLILR